jgi:hypothetical protein
MKRAVPCKIKLENELESYVKYIDRIISSKELILQDFQKFIFLRSGYQYTIIDLQGVRLFDDETKETKFVLADVEFTTSNLYHFTPHMLIEEFVSFYNVESVTLFDLDQKLTS